MYTNEMNMGKKGRDNKETRSKRITQGTMRNIIKVISFEDRIGLRNFNFVDVFFNQKMHDRKSF